MTFFQESCGTVCFRWPHTPDRVDDNLSYCDHCGACVGQPSQATAQPLDTSPWGHTPTCNPNRCDCGVCDTIGVVTPPAGVGAIPAWWNYWGAA